MVKNRLEKKRGEEETYFNRDGEGKFPIVRGSKSNNLVIFSIAKLNKPTKIDT